MPREYVSIDISDAPVLKRLAEAVRQSGKPHALKDGAETVAVVHPSPENGRRTGAPRRAATPRRTPEPATDDPVLAQLFAEDRRRNREVPMDLDVLFAPPTPEQIAKRKAVIAQIMEHLPQRSIAPLTAPDLIHEARA